MSDNTVLVEMLDDVAQINCRGNAQAPAFKDAVESVLGQSLPTQANTVSFGDNRICWLGPDEWLLLVPGNDATPLLSKLEAALSDQTVAMNDVSGGQVVLRMSGSSVVDLLAKGCPLDFHESRFPPGSCAQSGLGKAGALFVRADSGQSFDVVVRRSFLEYMLAWLRRAGAEFNIELR